MTPAFADRLPQEVHGLTGIACFQTCTIRGRKLAIVVHSGRGSGEDAGNVVKMIRKQVAQPGHGLSFSGRPYMIAPPSQRDGPIDPSVQKRSSSIEIDHGYNASKHINRLEIADHLGV